MIKVDFKHSATKNRKTAVKIDTPLFAQYTPDFKEIEKVAKKHKSKKNIVVIGNGGSITSFHYYFTALGSEIKKRVFIVSTMEPDFLADVKKKCNKKDTVVIVVSKSGNTVGVIESMLYLIDYPTIVITENKKSAIKNIQEAYDFDYVEHPPVGGRYSGFTPSGLLPAAIAGLDIKAIWEGAKKAYSSYAPGKSKNLAVELAHALYELDKKGYNEIFMPIYSSGLLGSKDIITQLIHESVGKNKKGQTILSAFAPESQHHTNQRFFGGRQNMIGCFIIVDEFNNKFDKVTVPKKIKDVQLRDGTLSDLQDNYYSKSLSYEFIGTREDTNNHKIPNIVIHVKKINPESVGQYLAFWHYVTVYLCTFNNVNPFDQPQVETSKNISFQLRKK
ncbi:hypothetical protein H6503_02455 [Candidatus Woesearchaeota archaeon]|nr:hypothetical protein [Candidatus Woesearchaeota archaeon]